MPLFITDGVIAAREEYLFSLAVVCHVPPPVVDELTVTDFGWLTTGLEALAEGD